jgi:hypothetical protein
MPFPELNSFIKSSLELVKKGRIGIPIPLPYTHFSAISILRHPDDEKAFLGGSVFN